MSGGCDTTDEDRERWARDYAFKSAESKVEALGARDVLRVASLLPEEHAAARTWLHGYAAALQSR